MDTKIILEDRNIWTISNFLSSIRIFLGIIIYFLILNHASVSAILIAIVAIVSDFADGYLARKRNEVSELGKILDPLGDKVSIALGSIALYQSYGLPLWIVVVIISRDFLIVLGSLILMHKTRKVTASEIPGKIAVTIVSLLLLSYLFEFHTIPRVKIND